MPIGRYYLELVLARWKPLLGIVAACTFVAWFVTVALLGQFPKFEGAARLNIVPTSEELGYASHFESGSTFDGGSVLLQTYGEYAHTRPIVAPIIDRYIEAQAQAAHQTTSQWLADHAVPSIFAPGPWISWLQYGSTPPMPPRENLLNKLIQNTTLDTVEGTYLLRVTVDWSDPASAAFFANALADSIVEQADATSHISGNEIAGSLGAQLATTQAELAAKLRRSRDLKNAIGVVDVDRQKQDLLDARTAELAQLTSDRSDLVDSRGRVAALRKRAKGKLSLAQQAVVQALAIEEPKLDGLTQGIPIRESRISTIGGQLAALSAHEQEIKTLDDETGTLQTEVNALQVRQSFAQTENLANAPRIRLIEHAVPPLTRSSPKMLFNTALGFIAGCALAGCWLLLFDTVASDAGSKPARAAADPDEGTPLDPAAPGAETPETATEPLLPLNPPHIANEDDGGEPLFQEAVPISDISVDQDCLPVAPVIDEACAAPELVHALADGGHAPLRKRAADGIAMPLSRAASRAESACRLYPGRLPQPADGGKYATHQLAEIGARIDEWLAAPLASRARALAVFAAGADRDARLLCDLLRDHLAAAGEAVRFVDGTEGTVLNASEDGEENARSLIYGGGFDQSARRWLPGEIDGEIILAISAPVRGICDILAELRGSTPGLAGKKPYVVAIDD